MGYYNLLLLSLGEYGVPKRWNFLFTKSYWCSKYSSDNDGGIIRQNIELQLNNEGNYYFLFIFQYMLIFLCKMTL